MTIEHFLPVDYTKVPCRANPELHFGNARGESRELQDDAAKSVCRTGYGGRPCPALGPCLRYALRYAVEGVWAGTTLKEREAMRERAGAVPVSIVSSSPVRYWHRETA